MYNFRNNIVILMDNDKFYKMFKIYFFWKVFGNFEGLEVGKV